MQLEHLEKAENRQELQVMRGGFGSAKKLLPLKSALFENSPRSEHGSHLSQRALVRKAEKVSSALVRLVVTSEEAESTLRARATHPHPGTRALAVFGANADRM